MTTTLTGTENQIAFAADIREKALAEHRERIAAAKAKGSDPAKIAAVEEKVERLSVIADSRWWIDNGQLPAMDRLARIDWVYEDRTGMGRDWYPGAGA